MGINLDPVVGVTAQVPGRSSLYWTIDLPLSSQGCFIANTESLSVTI